MSCAAICPECESRWKILGEDATEDLIVRCPCCPPPGQLIAQTFDDVCEPRIPLRDKNGVAVAWAKCDPEDYGDLSQFNWHRDSMGYARRSVSKNKHERMHKRLMGTETAVDHINGDKLDNRRANLRRCTQAENLQNHPGQKGKTSVYRGVSWHARARKWEAGYTLHRKKYYLGLFESEQAAAEAAAAARLKVMPFTVEAPIDPAPDELAA